MSARPVVQSRLGRLATLLRFARRSIAIDAVNLGSFPRLQARVGRSVTQDEVAEAVGISRQWYASLEQALPVNVSIGVLERIANVLMLSAQERDELFDLAVPAIARLRSELDDGSVEDLGFVKSVARRLWAARSESDALIIVADALSMLLKTANIKLTS
jgi:transcriptional regulator with XRE-family HTH domain